MFVLVGCVVGALILLLVAVAWWPVTKTIYVLHTSPPLDYGATVARVRSLLAQPAEGVREECRSTVLDHGYRTRDAYVLLHGLTNCPAQFDAFARRLHAAGANVLLLRLPHHGMTDRMTTASAQITAQDMLDSANLAVDLAHGYGERVTVVGLSVSGVTAAWIAQMRPDVDLAVCIAPFFAPAGTPEWLISPLSNLLLRAPNAFLWWDPRARENLPGSPFSYPRFPTHAIGEVMRLGLDTFHRAARSRPKAPRILLVVSPTDSAISLPRVAQLATLWGPRVVRRDFPTAWNVPHDCIDPRQPGEQTALVYPQLEAWMNEALAR